MSLESPPSGPVPPGAAPTPVPPPHAAPPGTAPDPASAPAEGGGAARPRLHYLDNLRVALTVLVVLHHVAVTYGNIPVWYYIETAQDPTGGLLDLLAVLNQAFFMGFFFLVSGFFVPGSHDRKGGRGFLRGRLVRLGVPLLAFVLLVRPVVTLGVFQEYADELPYWLFYLVSWNPGPLWFVETLLVFCLVYVLLRRVGARRTAPAAATARGAGRMPGPLAVAGFTAALIVLTALWRLLVPVGSYWPIIGVATPAYLPQYVLLFAVGAMAFRRGWFDRVPPAAGWAALPIAVAGAVTVAITAITGATEAAPLSWPSLLYTAAESVFAVSVIIALLCLFQHRFNRQRAFGRFLSANAYAVYFLHAVVLVGLGYAFAWWDSPAIAKFTVVGALSLPLCWGAAALLRALPGAKRVF
ncbi:acyltransferase family protein [Streptomonospora nanhaiensis]|uniref:acyltransferase family protein n=1 Tax=Streptomonospora nanhaiensis TaxID=1323731 RepID=UPI001C38E00F|nr:acyltransferase family protein [Streptomonospora nanhaiensis]MBV2365632.1 acyltransferase family protein [Streptomonospora nanhaiensis]